MVGKMKDHTPKIDYFSRYGELSNVGNVYLLITIIYEGYPGMKLSATTFNGEMVRNTTKN